MDCSPPLFNFTDADVFDLLASFTLNERPCQTFGVTLNSTIGFKPLKFGLRQSATLFKGDIAFFGQ